MGTTNIDLERIAKENNIPLNYIIFKNELNKIPYKNGLSIIINMSSTHHTGTHWLAMKLTKNNILYSDSFGIEPPEEVVNYARKNNVNIIYNDYQLEELDGTNCGQLALFWLLLTKSN